MIYLLLAIIGLVVGIAGIVRYLRIRGRKEISIDDEIARLSGEKLPPISPGEVLREEFLIPRSLTVGALATKSQIPEKTLVGILTGSTKIDTATAQQLGKFFKTTPQFWSNLQFMHDDELANP